MNKLRTYEYQHSSRLARFVERWRGLANSFLLLLLYDRKKTRENNRKIWHAQLQVGSHQCSPDGTTSRNRRRPGRRRPCRSWRPPWRRPWAVGWTIRVKWPRPARRGAGAPPQEEGERPPMSPSHTRPPIRQHKRRAHPKSFNFDVNWTIFPNSMAWLWCPSWSGSFKVFFQLWAIILLLEYVA